MVVKVGIIVIIVQLVYKLALKRCLRRQLRHPKNEYVFVTGRYASEESVHRDIPGI